MPENKADCKVNVASLEIIAIIAQLLCTSIGMLFKGEILDRL